MKKIIGYALAISAFLTGCDAGYKDDYNTTEPGQYGWIRVVSPHHDVHVKCLDIEGHRYLITIRDGDYSHNASTIHAESCPCMNRGKE